MQWPLRHWPGTRAGAALAAIIIAVLPGAAACEAVGPTGASAEATSGVASGSWRTAAPVPGLARLNAGGNAWVSTLSCASAGNCAAGGSYKDSQGHFQAFVASERNGRWSAAIGVPGTVGRVRAGVHSMWCDSAGNCVAGGSYNNGQRYHAFVAAERDGRWATAVNVLRTAGLNAGGNAWVNALSCANAGNCAAGGSYNDRQGHFHVFLTSERNGRWGTAIEVPGIARLNVRHLPQVSSVSCGSAGNCVAGGAYVDSTGKRHAFVASERNGRWGTAIEVPGTRARSWVTSVSCGSAENCTTDGGYVDSSGQDQPFVTSERNGRWDTAIEVPGIARLDAGRSNQPGSAEIGPLSCTGAGYCVAGHSYTDYFGQIQGFIVSHRLRRFSKVDPGKLGTWRSLQHGDLALFEAAAG